MQVDPIKPTLKAPGPKRLKLKCDVLLSTFAFKFHLRRYIEELVACIKQIMSASAASTEVGRCRLTLSNLR